ncbi:hypothetical protein NA57DRAFT_70413 [Rhizodiscina lignyota]|uniref:MARVEL domain-containing protein n=1 Tax=Rhizodiscina lignyota TaxID=1504668 RepID=A0A9P4IMD3_9PEZI|nr:hypothetical protein NA57DRAFT_70413 [Rhizodiscina lignyota]
MFGIGATEGVSGGTMIHLILRMVLRVLQFILSLVVVGIYGTELKVVHYSVRYEYAVVVAALSALTAVIFLIPKIKSFIFFIWDFILFILWVGVFGSMGKQFINPKDKKDAENTKMRNTVWLDAVLMVFWFTSCVAGALVFLKHRREVKAMNHANV